jgi:GGDEF domain-containing protein
MLQTMLPRPAPDRRAPPPRPSPASLLVDVADAASFNRLAEREAMRSRRESRMMAVLQLQACEAPDLHGRASPLALDQALADCGRRLRGHIRSTDTLARWQTTQFGVLLPGCDRADAAAVLARLLGCASGPYGQDGVRLRLQVTGEVLRCL